MEINFKEEVLKRKELILKHLSNLLKINSELTTFDANRKGAPFGEGIRDALLYVLDLAHADGFKTVNLDGYAGHIEYGDSREFVAGIGHLDVVPATGEWEYPPYEAKLVNDKIFARGALDDKGPTLMFYFAMLILKELGLKLSKRIKLILATDEETDWRGINKYLEAYPEVPVSGFVPDADFPLIYAEKGIMVLKGTGKILTPEIISISGGSRNNMVPDIAYVVLTGIDNIRYENEFKSFLVKNAFEGKSEINGNEITLTIFGKSAHGATPELGHNAICTLFYFLRKMFPNNNLVNLVNDLFGGDDRGFKLGIAYTDNEMGDLTVNLGVVKCQKEYELLFNIRYPKGVECDTITSIVTEAFNRYETSVEVTKHQKLLYVDPKSPLPTLLMEVYKKHTQDFGAQPISIGGGTFARSMPNVVAFGPTFPHTVSKIHQPNEFITIEDFLMATAIYAESLYKLAK